MPETEPVYPVLEVHLTYRQDGTIRKWVVSQCCFHDLLAADANDLAGMGLAIIGNLIKLLDRDIYNEHLDAKLLLRRLPGDEGIDCPWPGMPNDAPVPLDLMQMPFDAAMFLGEDQQYKKRVSRLGLLQRVQAIWVPWLQDQLQRGLVHA